MVAFGGADLTSRVHSIGFDSKEFHSEPEGVFFAPIGLGVETPDFALFKRTYDSALDSIFRELNIDRRRKAFSYKTLEILCGGHAEEIAKKLLGSISDKVSNVWFFHTQVNSVKTPFIFSRGKYRKLPPLEYMRIHQQAYPSWCSWRLSIETSLKGKQILLDAFQSEETRAWYDLTQLRPAIVFKGDEVNPLISTADILLAVSDRILRTQILREPAIRRVFEGLGFNVAPLFIGQPHYRNITSVSRNPIDTRDYVQRPIVFVLNEKRPKDIDSKEWERTRFVSPVLDRPLSHAFEADGGLKAFDYDQDGGILNPKKDVFYAYGSDAKTRLNAMAQLYRIPPENLFET